MRVECDRCKTVFFDSDDSTPCSLCGNKKFSDPEAQVIIPKWHTYQTNIGFFDTASFVTKLKFPESQAQLL
jgi:hypothetical protein